MASKRETLIASAEKSLQKGKVDAALKDYLKVLEETPGDINVLNKVGDLFVRLNRNDESIPYFSKIAEHYSKDGFFLKAIAIYKKIQKLDPARLDVYERLAELYSKQGLAMEAKSQYQVLADYYTKQDNVTGAVGIYQKMVASEPANIQLHVKLADLFNQNKRIPDALKEYAVVAAMLRDRGAMDESVQVFEKALKIAPDNVEILKTFVPTLLEAGKTEEARAFLRKALETTPRSVPLFVLASDAALAANDMAEARNYSAKAQAVEPESEEVLACVVRVQLKGRRPDLAYAAASPLVDQYVRRGEARKALTILIPIAKAAPDNEDVLRKIVEIALAAGDERGTVPYRSALAEIWRRQGKIVEAAEGLRACTRLAPDVADYRARLAQLEPLLPSAAPPPPRQAVERPSPGDISFPGVAQKRSAAAPPPPAPKPIPTAKPDEFEFDLGDDLVEEAEPLPSEATPAVGSTPVKPLPPFRPEPPRQPAMSTTFDSAPPIGSPAGWAKPRPAPVPEALEFDTGDFPTFSPRAAPPSEPLEVVEEAEELVELPDAAELPVELPPPTRSAMLLEPARGPLTFGFSPPAAPPTLASPAVSTPAPAQAPPPSDSAIEEALVEAEVFRKYGLMDKALDQLRTLAARPGVPIRVREKLFEVYLEKGDKVSAKAEAAFLKERYQVEGREDRSRALDGLLGEGPPPAAAPEPRPAPVPAPVPVPTPVPEKPVPAPVVPAVPQPPAVVTVIEVPWTEPAPVPSPTQAPAKPLGAEPAPAPAPAPAPPPAVAKAPSPPPAVETPKPAPKPKAGLTDVLDLLFTKPKKKAGVALATPIDIDLPADLLGDVVKHTKKVHAPPPEAAFDLLAQAAVKPKPAAEPETAAEAAEPAAVVSAAPSAAPAEPPPAVAEPEPPPPVPVSMATAAVPILRRPSVDELAGLDFCLEQGMVVDAAERLQTLDAKYPGDPDIKARRTRLEGSRSSTEIGRPALADLLSDDLEFVLDAELGRALTDEVRRGSGTQPVPVTPAAASPAVDESGLFSDEAEFFNFADELQTEMTADGSAGAGGTVAPGASGEVSLEEIFREFKKGVEQQLSPEDFETHYNLGIAYKEMMLTDEAIGEFQLASKDPAHAVECCSMLGLCFLEKGLPQLAIKWYRKGLDAANIREEDRLGLLYDLGRVYSDVGDTESAKKTYVEIYGSNAQFRDVGDRLRQMDTL